MDKLTDKQQQLVTDNHNLIYWYAHKRHLKLEEWYGELAIVLCNTIKTYNPSKCKLSTYFCMKCDGMTRNKYKAKNTQKRTGKEIEYKERYHGNSGESTEDTMMLQLKYDNLINNDTIGIIPLLEKGYTQYEIAQELGVCQSQISKLLKRYRKDYENDR